jgi:hypothetical protein
MASLHSLNVKGTGEAERGAKKGKAPWLAANKQSHATDQQMLAVNVNKQTLATDQQIQAAN